MVEQESADTDVVAYREEQFDYDGPVDIAVEFESGRLDVQLVETTATSEPLRVRIRPDTTASSWAAGLTGLLSWLGEQAFADRPGELADQAVGATVVEFVQRRLTIHGPRHAPLRTVPLIIEVTASAGSSIVASAGAADLTLEGVAERVEVSTGSGQVRVQRCTAGTEIRTGSGAVRLGSVLGMARVRTGSGTVDVVCLEAVQGSKAIVQTGSGNVRINTAESDLTARTGSGDLTICDARAGRLELTSGSGQLRVGIHAGTWAELDVSSGSGQARSELPVTASPPAEGSVPLRVRARTGSGDALVTTAPC